jgi:hypothetical protein
LTEFFSVNGTKKTKTKPATKHRFAKVEKHEIKVDDTNRAEHIGKLVITDAEDGTINVFSKLVNVLVAVFGNSVSNSKLEEYPKSTLIKFVPVTNKLNSNGNRFAKMVGKINETVISWVDIRNTRFVETVPKLGSPRPKVRSKACLELFRLLIPFIHQQILITNGVSQERLG